MTKAKLVLALFLAVCASTLYAEVLDSLPAYCVTFPTDSSYRIHLIRHTKDFQSNYGCGCSNHSDKDEFFINFPRNLNKQSYTWMTYNLENAKRVLPEFYGQTFRGNKSDTKCKGDSYERKEQEFDILLVGPCLKTIPVARYCAIEGKKPALYRTEIFGNVPTVYLFDSTKVSIQEDKQQEIRCSGTARMHHKIEWDFAGIGRFKLGAFLEEDSCHALSKWNNYNMAELPKYVDFTGDPAFSITTNQLKRFYGKNIAVTWDLSMECGFKQEAHHIEYEVLLTGKCPSEVKIDSEKLNKVDPWRLFEVNLHGMDPLDIPEFEMVESCKLRRTLK